MRTTHGTEQTQAQNFLPPTDVPSTMAGMFEGLHSRRRTDPEVDRKWTEMENRIYNHEISLQVEKCLTPMTTTLCVVGILQNFWTLCTDVQNDGTISGMFTYVILLVILLCVEKNYGKDDRNSTYLNNGIHAVIWALQIYWVYVFFLNEMAQDGIQLGFSNVFCKIENVHNLNGIDCRVDVHGSAPENKHDCEVMNAKSGEWDFCGT